MNKKLLVSVLFCFLVFVLGTFFAWGQVKDEDKEKELTTKLELFLAEKGKLIVKDFYTLGKVVGSYQTSVELDAMVLYVAGEEVEKVRGLRFTVNGGGRLDRSSISFLDLEEIEGLVKAVDYMISLAKGMAAVQKDYTEIEFSTQGDFCIGFYQKGIKQKAFLSSGRIGRVVVHFSKMEKLNSIKVLADKGLEVLSEK